MKDAARKPASGEVDSRIPKLLTSGEVADWLRTSKKSVYAMVERQTIPGVVRIGRRVLFREAALIDWLGQKSSPSGR